MRRRIIGIVLAVVLAVVGTLALVRYVKSAKDDAVRPEELVQVLVVEEDVREGAPVSEVLESVGLVHVPRRLVAPGALTDLVALDPTLVTATELKVGDQTRTTVAPTRTPNTTHFVLHKILVTSVKFSQQDSVRASEIQGSGDDESTDTTVELVVSEAPSDQLLVTMAVSAAEAEQLVFAAEFGTIWLTSEGPDASEEGTRILTLAQVMVPVPR